MSTNIATMTRGWATSSGCEPLPADLRAAAQRVLDAEGPARAAARLGVSVAALTRACAGAGVRKGTIALLKMAIAGMS